MVTYESTNSRMNLGANSPGVNFYKRLRESAGQRIILHHAVCFLPKGVDRVAKDRKSIHYGPKNAARCSLFSFSDAPRLRRLVGKAANPIPLHGFCVPAVSCLGACEETSGNVDLSPLVPSPEVFTEAMRLLVYEYSKRVMLFRINGRSERPLTLLSCTPALPHHSTLCSIQSRESQIRQNL